MLTEVLDLGWGLLLDSSNIYVDHVRCGICACDIRLTYLFVVVCSLWWNIRWHFFGAGGAFSTSERENEKRKRKGVKRSEAAKCNERKIRLSVVQEFLSIVLYLR